MENIEVTRISAMLLIRGWSKIKQAEKLKSREMKDK